MSTPETPLLERLCRSLAFHVVETEGTMQFMDTPLDLIAEAAQARALIAEAGFDIDVLHSLAYPFTVLEDKNPKGRAWLLSVLAQAQRA